MSDRERRRLPNRRLHVTNEVQWSGMTLLVSVGFDRQGRACEIFADYPKRPGSDVDILVDDACVLISMLLQHGYPADELHARLIRTEGPASGAGETGVSHPTILSTLLRHAAGVEAEEGAGVARAHAAIAGKGSQK